MSKSNLSQANYLAFGDWFIGQVGFHRAEIIVIEESDHAPGTDKANNFTSRSSPEEWFAASMCAHNSAEVFETRPEIFWIVMQKSTRLAAMSSAVPLASSFCTADERRLVAELKNDFSAAFALCSMRNGHFCFAQRVGFFDLRF